MSVICVVGAGMMGSALCVPLVDAGHEVRLVGTHLDSAIVERLQQDRVHPKMGIALPDEIRAFQLDELSTAMEGVDVIGLGVSSAGVRWAAQAIAPFVAPERPVLMITKGLEWDGRALRVLPDVLSNALAAQATVHPVAVAGPCIAGELARRVDTCVVFAGRDAATAQRLASTTRTPYYHTRATKDFWGAEVCAALKNAYAMGIGFAAGLHERRGGTPGSVALHNYESAVFAQAVVEMQRLVSALGGKAETAAGLAGAGDLDVTCNGGRTGRFGRLLGLGLSVPDAIDGMGGATLECLDILKVLRDAMSGLETVYDLSPRRLPLLSHLIAVALEGAPVAMPFDAFAEDE